MIVTARPLRLTLLLFRVGENVNLPLAISISIDIIKLMKTTVPISPVSSDDEIRETAKLLRILADENRLKIVACLAGGEKCVCQLTEFIDIPQNLMSHHLRVLREHGLVQDNRRGQWVYYSLKSGKLSNLFSRARDICDCSQAQAPVEC